MLGKLKIMIVDDHEFYRKSLSMILSKNSFYEIVAQASNGKEFLNTYKNYNPDIIFMDIKMPVMNGIDATKKALDENRFVKIIVLTMFEEEEYFMKAMFSGAKGLILKDSSYEEINQSIRTVMAGNNYYPKDVIKSFYDLKKIFSYA